MDKTWMKLSRNSKTYLDGLKMFLDFAFSKENTGVNGMILCPCKTCKNEIPSSSYNEPINGDNMEEMLHDAYGVLYDDNEIDKSENDEIEEPNSEAKSFYKLVDDSQQKLWPGCKNFSKLSFLVRLYHIKCLGKISNKIFTMLLELLNEAFPEGVKLPKSNYQARKVIEELGLGYKKCDACPNDCTLYWGKDENRLHCETVVLLRSLFESKKIVAKGFIRSIDPDQNVGGKRLGLNWCEVQISVPIEWDEDLIRPYSNVSTIGDAIGTCIAWPLNLVISDDDQE